MNDKTLTEQIQECFDKGAKAVTITNGKLAPWTPFGVELDPKDFSRKKKGDSNE